MSDAIRVCNTRHCWVVRNVTWDCAFVLASREFWLDLGERLYEFRAPTVAEAVAWVNCLSVYSGCQKSDGKVKKVPIPPPLYKAMLSCLAYLTQHGTTQHVWACGVPHVNNVRVGLVFFLMLCFFCMGVCSAGITTEGIFRVPGSSKDKDQLFRNMIVQGTFPWCRFVGETARYSFPWRTHV
jgi:hypothetical protein